MGAKIFRYVTECKIDKTVAIASFHFVPFAMIYIHIFTPAYLNGKPTIPSKALGITFSFSLIDSTKNVVLAAKSGKELLTIRLNGGFTCNHTSLNL